MDKRWVHEYSEEYLEAASRKAQVEKWVRDKSLVAAYRLYLKLEKLVGFAVKGFKSLREGGQRGGKFL